MFSVVRASINGVECDPYFASEVTSGKKANEDISFPTTEFGGNDIGTYTDIALEFCVYDSEDLSADPVAETTIHIYPYGEETATKYERTLKSSDKAMRHLSSQDRNNLHPSRISKTDFLIHPITFEISIIQQCNKSLRGP